MRRPFLAGMIPLLLLLATGEAAAHAMLDHAEPRVSSLVATTPRGDVVVRSKLEAAFRSR
jgi:hypothetical protein